MCVVVEGSMGAELPGGGVAWAFMGVVVVVVGTVSRTGFPWTNGAFEAASSSESSEMKPSSGISVMTGRGGALGVSVAEAVALCFLFGCGFFVLIAQVPVWSFEWLNEEIQVLICPVSGLQEPVMVGGSPLI